MVLTSLVSLETIEVLQVGLIELQNYDERPEINATFEIPNEVKKALDLLKIAGVYLNGTGRSEVGKVTDGTVDDVITLVDSFVNYTIKYMSEVQICIFTLTSPVSPVFHTFI